MNAATANPQIDTANGKEPREFLGQSVGFENELIGQSNLPHQPRARLAVVRGQSLLTGRCSKHPGNPVPDLPPPAGICRQPRGLGKVQSWASAGSIKKRGCVVGLHERSVWPVTGYVRVSRFMPHGKPPLTVFRCNFTLSQNIRA